MCVRACVHMRACVHACVRAVDSTNQRQAYGLCAEVRDIINVYVQVIKNIAFSVCWGLLTILRLPKSTLCTYIF